MSYAFTDFRSTFVFYSLLLLEKLKLLSINDTSKLLKYYLMFIPCTHYFNTILVRIQIE